MTGIDLLVLDFDGVSSRPEALEVVDRARRLGVVTAILSNEIDPTWTDEYPVLREVDHVIACSDNRVFKPDRRAFQRCLLVAGCEAERTIVVDDQPDNVTVAGSLGMHAVWFDASDPDGSWARVDELLARP